MVRNSWRKPQSNQFEAGGAYAAARLRALRSAPPRDTLGIVGGVAVAGLLAFGIYALCKNGCRTQSAKEEDLP